MYTRINPHTLRDEIVDRTTFEKEVSESLSRCQLRKDNHLSYCSKLGELYRLDGNYQAAEDILKSVLLDLEDSSDEKLVFLTELRLAIVYQYAGDWENALNLFEKLEFEPFNPN
ncbi:MAG: tetratricopeptide repeat protein [Chitinophagales bacterium]|nr:tetratricopeptide repeat protein [Chitinophagales bacterium]